MLFVLAHVPLPTVLGGANVLSVLAETVRTSIIIGCVEYMSLVWCTAQVAGRWLRIWVVVDAVITLCGGVLTGPSGKHRAEPHG